MPSLRSGSNDTAAGRSEKEWKADGVWSTMRMVDADGDHVNIKNSNAVDSDMPN